MEAGFSTPRASAAMLPDQRALDATPTAGPSSFRPAPSTSTTTSAAPSVSLSRQTSAAPSHFSQELLDSPVFKPQIKDDILRIIEQFLGDEGFAATKLVLHDEANLKGKERDDRVGEGKKLKRAILDGDWPEVDQILSKPLVRTQKALLYAVYKQQFLEHVEYRELQKAFTLLNKRLKPLERFQPTRTEFRDLCYLLSAKTVHDAPSFKNWEGVTAAREKLAEMFGEMVEGEREEREGNVFVPTGRLVTLLEQAVSYQISRSRYKPKDPPSVATLLQDYAPFVVPNSAASVLSGHTANVKCVRFIGASGRHLVSGSSDNTVRIWDSLRATTFNVLRGHTSRIWDVDATARGDRVASASADRTVKVWNWRRRSEEDGDPCLTTLEGNGGDVYAARWHPIGKHIATGGYDKIVRLFDVEAGAVLKTFTGHSLSVSSVLFNPLGNLIVSGSKDGHIRFWDTVSGLNIRTLTAQVGEVTSVDMTDVYLLTSSRDNSIRLWDVRMLRPLKRYKSHSNTSENFVRASFAHAELIVSGSDDGILYMWDRESTKVVQTLEGHEGVVYGAAWNDQQSLLASYGSDFQVRTWEFDDKAVAGEDEVRGKKGYVIPRNLKLNEFPGSLITTPSPTPSSPTQIIIDVYATALNFFDILQIQGLHQSKPAFPYVAGAEFAGLVSSISPIPAGCPWVPGKTRVFGSTQGAFAEVCVADWRHCHEVPPGMGWEEAAGLSVTFPTSYAALVNRANIQPGEFLLIHAAAGGVGLAALQIGKALGAICIATGSSTKLDICKQNGADYTLDYNVEGWQKKVMEITQGRGADVVYDPVGMILPSLKCIAWNGRAIVVGFAAGAIEKIPANLILLKNIAVTGVFWGAYTKNEPEAIPVVWDALLKLFAEKKIRGVVYDKVYDGLETVPEGLRALGARETWGKVVVRVRRDAVAKL